jgi:CubicO group peptidase (beta-lactamase class C family)
MKYLLITLLIVCSILLLGEKAYSQNANNQAFDLNAWIDSQLTEGLDSFNIAGATIVLMQGDSVLHTNGYGLADIESNSPVNSSSSIFGVGSISKTFVATAIMQLYEDGKLKLDGDVNHYLNSFQLKYKFNNPITVRHILTHTAGFDVSNIGTAVRAEKDVIPLAQYLEKRMPPQIRPAGKIITYSNQGYALLGLIVEEVSGLPFSEYISQKILQPLEMNYSGFKRQAELKDNYATSYLQKNTQLIPYKPQFEHNYPAGALSSTASDMGHYISMFLNNGKYKRVQILDSASINKMFHTPFRQYEKAKYGWLLGFQESYWNGIQICGHGGEIQGFESQLTLIPEKNIGLFISVNSSSYPNSRSRVFIEQFIHNLLTQLLPGTIEEKEEPKVTTTIGSVDEPLEKFTGTYRYTYYSNKTLDKLGVLIGLAPEIEIIQKDNTLVVLPWSDKLIPISDLTFYSGNDNYIAFGRDTKGKVSYFLIEAFPYQRLKWYEPAKFQAFWVGSIFLLMLIYIISSAGSKLFVRNKKSHLIKKLNFSLASLVVLFIALLAFALIKTDPMAFFYGIPLLFKIVLVLPLIIIPLELFSVYSLIKAFQQKALRKFGLIYQSIIVFAALFFIPWLMYYNLIGFNY